MEVDPDYVGFETNVDEDLQEKRARVVEENARDAAVEKIRSIIDQQFSKEIEAKENELMTINKRLTDARCMMDRLCACVVASYYAASFTKPVDGAKGPDAGAAYHPAIQNVMRKAVTSVLSKNVPLYQERSANIADESNISVTTEKKEKSQATDRLINDVRAKDTDEKFSDIDTTLPLDVAVSGEQPADDKPGQSLPASSGKDKPHLGSRQRIKKTVVVGNVSKYIPPEQREGSDKSTHKWMVYVRGAKNEPRIDHFVRKVWFFLHPSYRPNDLVEVCEAPFHLTRRGWGEFPIRVQIHFCDRRNRPVDIIHQLRLDRTYTGLQTLGAETVCEVEIDKSSVQLGVDAMLDAAGLSTLPIDDVKIPNVKFTELLAKMDSTPAAKKTSDIEDSVAASQAEFEQKVVSSESSPMEVNYAAQNQFQPVTTSCTISSVTVSPPRKNVLLKECEGSPTVSQAESPKSQSEGGEAVVEKMDTADTPDKGGVIEQDEQKEKGGKEERTELQEVEEVSVSPRRKRKRRRDSCRASASEGEQEPEEKTKMIKLKGDSQTPADTADAGPAVVISGKSSPEETKKASTSSVLQKPDDVVLDIAAKESAVVVPETSEPVAGHGHGDKDEPDDGGGTIPAVEVSCAPPTASSPSKSQSPSPPQKILILGGSTAKGIEAQSAVPPLKTRQPVVIVSKSPMVGKGPIRLRSTSDSGLGAPCVNLIRSGLNVTPVLSVKVHPEATKAKIGGGSPLRKIVPCPAVQKYVVLEGGSVSLANKSGSSGQVAVPDSVNLPSMDSVKQATSKLVALPQVATPTSKASDPKPASVAIPLSSLLKAGSLSTHALGGKKPQSLMFAQSPHGPYITLKAAGVSKDAKDAKARQKRSFSADQSPKHTVSLVPVDLTELRKKSQDGPSQSAPTVQVQILTPPGTQIQAKSKIKTEGSPSTPTLTLQALQAVLSSGGQQVAGQKTERKSSESTVKSVKTVELAGQQQYVLATLVSPQGKQQLALINPSSLSLGSAKKVTQSTLKAKKAFSTKNSATKEQSKVSMKSLKGLAGDRKPSREEAMAILNKLMPDPVYKVIGDCIEVENLRSLLDDALRQVVKRVPLISAERSLTEFPFCALSEADFLEWNVGKQRASEWQRAILIRRVLKYLQNKSEKLRACQLPSKKFIVHWCLRHGYSVFTDEYEESDDTQKDKAEDTLPMLTTISSADDLLKRLQSSLEEKIRQNNRAVYEESDIEVDVVAVDDPLIKKTHVKQEPPDEAEINAIEDDEGFSDVTEESAAKIESFRDSEEVEAVAEMTRKFGFDTSATRGLPICHMVLAKALHQLVDQITRTSFANAVIRRDGETTVQRVAPDRIQVADVVKTLQETQMLNFLTDQNVAEGSMTAMAQNPRT